MSSSHVFCPRYSLFLPSFPPISYFIIGKSFDGSLFIRGGWSHLIPNLYSVREKIGFLLFSRHQKNNSRCRCFEEKPDLLFAEEKNYSEMERRKRIPLFNRLKRPFLVWFFFLPIAPCSKIYFCQMFDNLLRFLPALRFIRTWGI